MRAFVLSILLFCCALPGASAQSLSVFDLDTSAFPLVKAKFFAFDRDGDQVAPSPSEISVTEDGAPRAVISTTCLPVNPPQALSTVFAVSAWGSEDYVRDGNGSHDLAASAIKAWVRVLPPGQNECAISIFGYGNFLKQDFTADQGKLLDAATDVRSPSESFYDYGFLIPPAGGLLISKSGRYQRVLVLITDNDSKGGVSVHNVVAEAKRQGCIVYAITLGISCPQSLRDITAQTGGKWFERITTAKQAEDAAMMILRHAQGRSAGEITWRSGAFCVPGQRAVSVVWNGARSQESYPSAGTELEFSPATIFLSSKPVGRRFDATITIRSPNDAAVISDITSSDPAFDINPKSFSLPPGGSRAVTLSYTPPDSGYHWTKFDFRTDACTQSYYASGGFPGVVPYLPTLNLTRPNGGEILPVGADTAITWSGIPPTDTVKLELSGDSGKTWSIISNSASGGRFPWHVPNIPSAECLVKATHRELSSGSNWARGVGGPAEDADVTDGSICTDSSGNIYVTGWFNRTIDFDSITLTGGS
ncbi:MAG: hypothetical protein ABI876_12475, partial [Bacteroidota bacterium]